MDFITELDKLPLDELKGVAEELSNLITAREEDGKVFSDLVGRKIFRSHDKLEFFKVIKASKESHLGVTASYNPSLTVWDTSTSNNPFEVSIFYAHTNWWEAKARLGRVQESMEDSDAASLVTLFNFVRAITWM